MCVSTILDLYFLCGWIGQSTVYMYQIVHVHVLYTCIQYLSMESFMYVPSYVPSYILLGFFFRDFTHVYATKAYAVRCPIEAIVMCIPNFRHAPKTESAFRI